MKFRTASSRALQLILRRALAAPTAAAVPALLLPPFPASTYGCHVQLKEVLLVTSMAA